MTNNSIDFDLQSKPNITINMQNRNNFNIRLGNYLESKLVVITCCEIYYKMQILSKEKFIILFVYRRRGMKRDRWRERYCNTQTPNQGHSHI